jgi:hypothetical protein
MITKDCLLKGLTGIACSWCFALLNCPPRVIRVASTVRRQLPVFLDQGNPPSRHFAFVPEAAIEPDLRLALASRAFAGYDRRNPARRCSSERYLNAR